MMIAITFFGEKVSCQSSSGSVNMLYLEHAGIGTIGKPNPTYRILPAPFGLIVVCLQAAALLLRWKLSSPPELSLGWVEED
jgi:hypothetical protein